MTDRVTTAEDHELAERLQEFVYGSLTVLIAIGALSGERLDSARNAFVIVVGTAVATWLAHTFAAVLGVHIRERRAVTKEETATEFGHSWRVVTASVPTGLVLVGAGLDLYSVRTALTAGIVLCVVQLIVVGVFAGTRSGSSRVGALGYAAAATVIGLAIVMMEVVIHH
jgi:hypothetical protein